MPDGNDADRGTGSPLRLGISGFGRLAQNYYVPALRRLASTCGAVAVADPADACRAASSKLLPAARVYASQPAMLDAEQLDGLLVAAPPSAHLAAWQDAAARPGLAVFMEKPFVLAGQLPAADLGEAANRRMMVNFNRRFWPRYRRVGELLRSGAVGAMVSLELELRVDVSKWLAVSQHRVHKGEGGALYDLGSQMLDLAAVIVGERPSGVRAAGHSKRYENDHVDATLSFPSHPHADVRCVLAYDDRTRERVLLRGATGDVRVDDPNTGLHVVRADSAPRRLARRAVDFVTLARHAALRHTSMSRRTIELALAAFVEGVRTGGPFSPGFEEAAFNATVLEAAARSLASGGAFEPIVPPATVIPMGALAT